MNINVKKMITGSAIGAGSVLATAVAVFAATLVVTPTDTQGWSTASTNAGGQVNFVEDATSPYPTGALQLVTDETNAARAQYMHSAEVSLSDITELGYSTKQVAGPDHASASYQLPVFLTGDSGFATLVYEPYWQNAGSPDALPVLPGVWQDWDVDEGLFWSSSTVNCSNGTITAGGGGPPLYTLSEIQALCPEASVLGFGVNVGTFNPNYDIYVDGVSFNGTTYDFEQVVEPTDPVTQDECKEGGWEAFGFRNQGQCIRFVNTGQDSR